MWGRAMLMVVAVAVASCSDEQLHLGRGINLFSRYGYLSISMRVVPRNDTDLEWIFREPTVDIFRNTSLQTPLQASTEMTNSASPVFHGDFHMEFCDNLRQLLQAYFRDFTFERLDKPWRAFTASWSRAAVARHLGIRSSYVTGQHCYVLVRVSRHRESAKLGTASKDLELDEAVEQEVDNVQVGNAASVIEFVRNFGSDSIASYATGNSLYQVFVYNPPIYRSIKDRLRTQGVSNLSNVELASLFSPWSAEHIGEIQAASGNATVEEWATENLRIHFYLFTYTSLLKLHQNGNLLRKLDSLLGNEALLQLNLRMLSPAFKDSIKQQWFHEVIDNYLKLWEVNM
ncbi:torso-like protein isoform X2 [Zootermopsis nevadensis]|uniref:torso-like protein isoform X2 n=1 Tax=Zootermopsis nevadensis TaxID=136037 RepID=UPI000B8EDEEA|nr:torso-like protein isoform X2 [Zootermopsis nevadensis]